MQEGGYMTSIWKDLPPSPVSREGTIHDGEIYRRWAWVEPSIWTARMLTTLESGVKGGRWYSLWDKVWRVSTLERAWRLVKANRGAAGVDHQTIHMFENRLTENLDRLSEQLRTGRYHPQSIRRTWIGKPGSKEKRPLGIPTVRDRVVQTALRMVIEPIFEHDFSDSSYGFRPERGCKDALRMVQRYLDTGNVWVVDADIKGYFDHIDHDRLMELVCKKVTDGKVLSLLQRYLSQQVIDGLDQWNPDQGTPQGAVISPLLANIFLDPLDHLMQSHGFEMIRYADDFVVLCHDESTAEAALTLIQTWTSSVGLELHPTKTKIVHADRAGFDFLGYHFENGIRTPSKKSMKKFKDKIRLKTRRANGHSLSYIIADINRTLRGWFDYFKHSFYKTFKILDQWIRMRLRSIMRKWRKGHGLGIGLDHIRWPNIFFVEHGLFSMVAAHAKACQSARR